MSGLLLSRVDVDGRCVDVRVSGSVVGAVADRLTPQPSEQVVDAHGAALLPGLHDHHIHVLAAAAMARSVQCGPPAVADVDALRAALRSAPGDGWIRGVGYAETVAGSLDRHVLDAMVVERPVRVQHRSGALWVLNTLAMQVTGLDQTADPAVERGADGAPTGRLWRFDARLRSLLDEDDIGEPAQSLAQQLLDFGITGVTDATPDLDAPALGLLAELPLDVVALGAPDGVQVPAGVSVGPRKLLLPDHDLPPLDELVAAVATAHARGRGVAVHCVTRESLVLTVLAPQTIGVLAGDRIEHAAVVPPDLVPRLVSLRVAVVTQPSFIARRGDDYLRDVAPDDVGCLYPYASLLRAGIAVAPSSDAPYGELDPWQTIRAARDRRASSGAAVAAHERVDPRTALGGFLSSPLQPGGAPRRVEPGVAADLCLLDAPLDDVLDNPDAGRVRLVLKSGAVVRG